MKNTTILIVAALLFFCLITPSPIMARDMLRDVKIHGFVSQGFLYSDEYNYLSHKSTDGSFEYNEVGINFSQKLTNKLMLGLQFFARDVGDAGNNKVALDWAYGDYRFKDWLGVRFGKVKLPLGLWNEVRDFDMLRPWIVLPQGQYRELLRDATVAANGLGLYGNIRAGKAGDFSYFAVAGNIYSDPEQGVSKVLEDAFASIGGSISETPENEMLYSGNLRWNTPLPGLMIGVWSLLIDNRTTAQVAALNNLEINIRSDAKWLGYMVEYTWNDFSLWAEYLELDVTATINSSVFNLKQTPRPENYYLGMAYRFTDLFQLGAYYAEAYTNGNDKDGSDQSAFKHNAWEKDLALTCRFDLNEYWVFKLEGHYMDGTRNVLVSDNPDSDLSKQSWYYGAAKLSVSF